MEDVFEVLSSLHIGLHCNFVCNENSIQCVAFSSWKCARGTFKLEALLSGAGVKLPIAERHFEVCVALGVRETELRGRC